MKVAIIGAGFSGIATARILGQLGHECTIFEKCPDIGGVWSSTRWYPGMQMQNTKDTYHLSDMPMPASYPEWPSAQQIQAYFEAYVDRFGLRTLIRLNEEVVSITPFFAVRGQRWRVTTASGAQTEADHVVVCSGIFSEPWIPKYAGTEEFLAAGGHLYHTSQLGGLGKIANKKVLIVGYGRSACDVANAVSRAGGAAGTTMVARNVMWKLPRRIRGINYKWLLLTRLGETLFEQLAATGEAEASLETPRTGTKLKNKFLRLLENVVREQLNLARTGLVPDASFETLTGTTLGLSTEGFFQKVEDGIIRVCRNASISRLGRGSDGRVGAILDDGIFEPADVIICGTGWSQQPPEFLAADLRCQLTDNRGGWLLYRQLKPIAMELEGLTFNGRSSSLFSTIASEAGALWIGAYLARGESMLPDRGQQAHHARQRLDAIRGNTNGSGSIVPVSLSMVDEVLDEAGVNVRSAVRAKQWVIPINPADYKGLAKKLAKTLAKMVALEERSDESSCSSTFKI